MTSLKRAFLGRAVAFLDDAEEPAGRVAEDAAEAHRVVHDGGPQQAGRLVLMLALEQVGQRLGPQQRLVADQHQHGPLIASEQSNDKS